MTISTCLSKNQLSFLNARVTEKWKRKSSDESGRQATNAPDPSHTAGGVDKVSPLLHTQQQQHHEPRKKGQGSSNKYASASDVDESTSYAHSTGSVQRFAE